MFILWDVITWSVSQFCSFRETVESKGCGMPRTRFYFKDNTDIHLEKAAHIIWVSLDTTSWIRDRSSSKKSELAIDMAPNKKFVKQTWDAWRIVLNSSLPMMTERRITYKEKPDLTYSSLSYVVEQVSFLIFWNLVINILSMPA